MNLNHAVGQALAIFLTNHLIYIPDCQTTEEGDLEMDTNAELSILPKKSSFTTLTEL